MIKSLGVKAPETGNDLGEAYAFNLMFGTQIGPTGKFQGYVTRSLRRSAPLCTALHRSALCVLILTRVALRD